MWRPSATVSTSVASRRATAASNSRIFGGCSWPRHTSTFLLERRPDALRLHTPFLPTLNQRRPASMGPMLPPAAAQASAAAAYPDGSAAQALLDRCLEAAVSRGTDLTVEYEPWFPVDMMQTLLLNVHDATGCSWLTATMLAVVGIRVVTLPISVSAIRAAREKALIQPRFQELMEKQKSLTLEGNQEKMAKLAKETQEFTQKHGRFFMLKGTGNLILFQMPLYVTAFATMRGFANHPDTYRSFAMEAPLWLDSLALPDPYAILPLVTAGIMLTNTELFGSIDTEVAQAQQAVQDLSSSQASGQNVFQKYQKWIMRATSLIFVPMTWNFPAGVFIFMSTNLLTAVVQNRILRHPVLERLLEIPPTAEKVKAANAEAAKGEHQVPALVPFGDSLPQLKQLSGRTGATNWSSTTGGRPESGVKTRESTFPLLEAVAASNAGAPHRPVRTVADLQVDPRYAVQRVRSGGSVAVQGAA